MREIKFRGLCGCTWVYGNFIKGIDTDGSTLAQIEQTDPASFQVWDVDYSTVGQLIGKKSADGKDLYEGDIVSACFPWGCVGGEIVYRENECCFVVSSNGEDIYFSNHGNMWVLEGNIHENPELLEDYSCKN